MCGRNRLENGSASHWAEAFAAHGGLVEVRLPQNGIRMEGIAAIAQGLSKCPALEVLDLQDNTATKTGTRSIVKHLTAWPGLKVLNLSDCLLGPAGGIALATSLSLGSNAKLEELRLQYGEFDKRTVELLSTAVAQHLRELALLELNGNRFAEDDECVEDLRKALALHGHEDALDDCGSTWGYEICADQVQWTIWRKQATRRRRKMRMTRKRTRTRRGRRQVWWMMESTLAQQEKMYSRLSQTSKRTSEQSRPLSTPR